MWDGPFLVLLGFSGGRGWFGCSLPPVHRHHLRLNERGKGRWGGEEWCYVVGAVRTC